MFFTCTLPSESPNCALLNASFFAFARCGKRIICEKQYVTCSRLPIDPGMCGGIGEFSARRFLRNCTSSGVKGGGPASAITAATTSFLGAQMLRRVRRAPDAPLLSRERVHEWKNFNRREPRF